MQALEAVQAVIAVKKSKKRIDREVYPQNMTFFSEHDLWQYDVQYDDRLCNRCEYYLHLNGGLYHGDKLLTLFPYMDVTSDNEIAVNLHPNCRCLLFRVPLKSGGEND